ncbi:DUF4350 domain-containing protein [Pelagerythrobacter marensis]|uniref:DUF4350 domain-containing protein n=1 Tax=Pelagerythrobacter marensis TaxID=543877 RepID=A0ABZ2CZ05_9SPHN
MRSKRNRLVWLAGLAALAIGVAAWALSGAGRPRGELGLFTTLPIYWGETAGMSELLGGETDTGWVRTAIERRFELIPLDTLADDDGAISGELAELDHLLLAQPRALSPYENVALDEWVRAGGRVLVFADPMLTAESRFAIGDRRRPQDVVLLSPILGRWGLEMRYDAAQDAGERTIATDLAPLPVRLAGTLHPVEDYSASAEDCWIAYDRVFARCAIGRGEATVIADAAVLEPAVGDRLDARKDALSWLLESAFGETR